MPAYLSRASIAEQIVPQQSGPGLSVGQLSLEVAAAALGRADRLHVHDTGALVHGTILHSQVYYALVQNKSSRINELLALANH